MKHKILMLLGGLFVTFILGLFSCDNCGPFPNKYRTTGLDWGNYEATYSDTSATKLILSEIENDSVIYSSYSILIRPIQETYFAQNTSRWDLSLIPSAYACSPATPTTDERIDSIVILSDKDLDLYHPANTDLSDLFDIVVLDLANGIYQEKYSLVDYLATNPSVPNEWTLILKGQPGETSEFEFTVKYFQSGVGGNDYFEFRTEGIVIERG